jgi:ATP-dependent Lhr-like helicase
LTIERWREYLILHCAFGLQVNRTFAMLLAALLSDQIGAPVGVQQDPYRIMLRTEGASPGPEELKELILQLAAKPIEPLAEKALSRSRLFKMRFIHVARRFGAIARDATLSDLDLENVIRSFEGTAVFEEALREAQDKDVDIPRTAELLKGLIAGELTIAVLQGAEASPIASIVEVLKRGYEVIPPERMHQVILKYVKARLLDESLTFVCTSCWEHLAVKRIADIDPNNLNCPVCESHHIGAVNADEGELRSAIRNRKATASGKRGGKVVTEAKNAAELITTYGMAALMTLAGKGLSVEDAKRILKTESGVTDRLIELIIEAEKDALKRKFYRRGKEK